MPPKKNAYKFPNPLPLGLVLEDNFKKKWRLGPSIGKGGFGEIYSAQENSATNKNTYNNVVKIEPHENGPLFVEMHFYLRNAKPDMIQQYKNKKKLKLLGMPTYLGSGKHEHDNKNYRFIVMEKFGTDISKLFFENNRMFPAETVFKLGVQLLDVIAYIHSRGYVHADIKGANILLGTTSDTKNQIYLVDFGLVTRFSTSEKPDPKKAHNGTLQYISRDGHLGIQSKRSDLEILGYNMIEWLGCTLPWDNGVTNTSVVHESKKKCMKNLNQFFRDCFGDHKPPDTILKYMEYVANLKFGDEPDIEKLRNILIAGIEAAGSSLKSPFKFKSVKTPLKRTLETKAVLSPKKAKVVKKKKIVKTVNDIVENDILKNGTEEENNSALNNSTEGYTEAMLSVKNKIKNKKQIVKAKVVSTPRALRVRKSVTYRESSLGYKENGNVNVKKRRKYVKAASKSKDD